MRLITFIVAIIAASVPASAQGWREYEYPNEGFTVAFPAEPKVETTSYQASGGRLVEAHVYSVVQEGGEFKVTIADLSHTEVSEGNVMAYAVLMLSRRGEVRIDIPHSTRRIIGLAARPQTPSDSSNHSTSPMGGGCLTLSAMSLGRDNRIARRYRNELFLRFFSEASEGFAPPRTRAGPRPQTRRRNPTPPFRTACPGCTYRDSLRQVWVIALQDELAVAIKSPASRLAEPKPGFR
jgi:hypothetical protein